MPVCPLHLKLSKINLEMNLIAKHKYTESQKLDMRTQRWQLERHIAHVKSNNIYIFFAFFVFALLFVIQEKRQKVWLFILKQSLILLSVYVIIVTRLVRDEFTPKLG